MASIGAALRTVNKDVAKLLEPISIERICREVGHRWRGTGPLTPPRLVMLCILQVLRGNASCRRVRLWGDEPFTRQAFCQARKRLPLAVFERVAEMIADRMPETPKQLWNGLRVTMADGTSCSMPDTPELAEHFGYPGRQKEGLGQPNAHLLHVFDHPTGMLRQTLVGPRATNDLSGIPEVVGELGPGDLLLGDRAFGCYIALAMCLQRGVEAVFHLNVGVITDFREGRRHGRRREPADKGLPKSRFIRKLGKLDQVVAYPKSRLPSAIVDRETFDALPDEIEVREIKFKINRKGFRPKEVIVVTTLLDPERYPKDEITDLYMDRWEVETNIGYLKQTLSLDILKGESVDVVMKEIVLHTICYNVVRLVMLEAARRSGTAPDRMSFADARDWLADNASPQWLFQLVENPYRPGRFEPRCVKRRPKPFKLLERPRAEIKKEIERKKTRQRHAA